MGKIAIKQQLNLTFFTLFCTLLQSDAMLVQNFLKIKEEDTQEQSINKDEQLLIDLSDVVGDFYKKIIETTMLYFFGMLKNSDQFHHQLLLETSKHALMASKIFAQYVSTTLQDPKISWKIKIKRCAYLSSFLVIIIMCVKEFYDPNAPASDLPEKIMLH